MVYKVDCLRAVVYLHEFTGPGFKPPAFPALRLLDLLLAPERLRVALHRAQRHAQPGMPLHQLPSDNVAVVLAHLIELADFINVWVELAGVLPSFDDYVRQVLLPEFPDKVAGVPQFLGRLPLGIAFVPVLKDFLDLFYSVHADNSCG